MEKRKVLAAALAFCISIQGLASCTAEKTDGNCPGSGRRGLLQSERYIYQ